MESVTFTFSFYLKRAQNLIEMNKLVSHEASKVNFCLITLTQVNDRNASLV